MSWSHSKIRRSVTAVVAASSCLLLTTAGIEAAQARPSGGNDGATRATSSTEVQAPVPQISWHVCADNPGLRCGTAMVPLDYDLPNGAKISLNLVKRPADLPAEKIGSLFVNPGGPGGSAAGFVPYAAALLGAPVRQRFDVIGVDPRGIAGSTPVFCTSQLGDPELPPRPSEAFPRSPRQIDEWLTFDDAVRALCADGGNAVLDHMSTADTARDMDLIRQAVGDPMLTYYGISYGTQLGTTYAAMFPGRVRAMVLDAVLDPVQWTTGRFGLGQRYTVTARLHSGYGSWEALTSAFAECDRVGPRACPQAGRIGYEYNRVVAKLRTGAVHAGGSRITYANVIGTLLGGLYDARNYPAIMSFVHDLYGLIFSPSPLAEAATARSWANLKRAVAESRGIPPRYLSHGSSAVVVQTARERISPQFHAVACSDSVNPDDPSRSIASARFANREGPGFGALWSWASSVCVNWPGSSADAFRGPWRTNTAHPILITGNTHDPATPISGARAVNKLFPGSVMFTVDTWGHGALGHSQCAKTKWDAYLVSGRLPANGLVCQPNSPLFPR